ncbi:ANTAR domain-containing protein [Pseudarthrobacter sp. Fe7]|nr:ANTAR domain-containing protein [Pseudarthrobacter sp. Fe7]
MASGAWSWTSQRQSTRTGTRLATEAVAASALNRAVIEQAKGVLMGRTGVTADQAYELMSQLSQDTNRKVHAVAQDIVDRATVRPEDPAGQDHPLLSGHEG